MGHLELKHYNERKDKFIDKIRNHLKQWKSAG